MILTDTFSEVGRCTGQHLDNLRRQLGVGIDPAYDYSGQLELQKKLTLKKEKKKPGDDAITGCSALDQLRKALKEATTPEGAAGAEAEERGMVSPGHHTSHQLGHKTNLCPSWSFKTTSRDYLASMAVENRWRAPPPGSYRPKAEVCDYRVHDTNFGTKPVTRSRHIVQMEKEVAQLKEEGKPVDHILQPCTSVELLDEKPENLRRRQKVWNFSKDLERPDPVKSAGIVFNHNTFDQGVLGGDLRTSKFTRRPFHEFSTTVCRVKDRETFFQPGQYKVNEVHRPKGDRKNIPFERQTKRPPMNRGKPPAGFHLPDRSLARSCPALSDYRRSDVGVPDFEHYTTRPPPYKVVKPYHKAEDPEIDQAVLHRLMTHDEMEAVKATWNKNARVEKFEESLTRHDHFKIQRSYGENILLKLAKENITSGPVSVEMAEEVGNSPISRRRVCVPDFGAQPEREGNQRKHAEPAARNKDLTSLMKFERDCPPGAAKVEVDCLSPTSGTICKLRSKREYHGVEVGDDS